MPRITFWEWLGWAGALVLLLAYALLSLSVLDKGVPFHLLNLLGALAVGKAALCKKSYPAAFVEFAWAFIAASSLLCLLCFDWFV
ncbi:MAG TPA: hypothetical protein VE988_21125 [Gemmataceae bacterium]|nr:hypothetical protein [Gemmataceae bacterium]